MNKEANLREHRAPSSSLRHPTHFVSVKIVSLEIFAFILFALLLLLSTRASFAQTNTLRSTLDFSPGGIQFVDDIDDLLAIEAPLFIDTRNTDSCSDESVSGALCLNANQLTYPDGRLASFRDINWLLGTLGADESRDAVVFGDDQQSNHFVAGILYLLGQKRVHIFTKTTATKMTATKTTATKTTDELLNQLPNARGQVTGLLRKSYYRAAMRDAHILLATDIDTLNLASKDADPNLSEDDVFVYSRTHGEQFVFAKTPFQAIATFARILAGNSKQTMNSKVFVHADGLGQREPSSFESGESTTPPTIMEGSSLPLAMEFTN